MTEQPVLAENPSDVRVFVVRDNSSSSERETHMGNYFPSMSEMISGALGKLESEGYALLDIRYTAIPRGNDGYEHFAMLIGKKRS